MKKIAISVVLVICLLGAFVLGMRVGGEAFYGFDSPYRAALTVAKLKSLEAGDTDHLRDSLEFDLDSYIYSYGINASPMYSWVFPEMTNRIDVENAMRHVVAYRNSHPSQALDEEIISTFSQDQIEFMHEQDRVILKALNHFGYESQPNQAKQPGTR